MARQLFRIEPKLPAGAMKTYAILRPTSTHFRPATCAEVDCPQYLHGWRTVVDESTDLGARQAHYIRTQSGRSFHEQRDRTGVGVLGAVTFTFGPGQMCFRTADHRVPVGRPELFVVREGDWRGNPRRTEPRVHKRAADWVDDFANHQDRLATRLGQG
jgi:hypothetical protein